MDDARHRRCAHFINWWTSLSSIRLSAPEKNSVRTVCKELLCGPGRACTTLFNEPSLGSGFLQKEPRQLQAMSPPSLRQASALEPVPRTKRRVWAPIYGFVVSTQIRCSSPRKNDERTLPPTSSRARSCFWCQIHVPDGPQSPLQSGSVLCPAIVVLS